MKLDPDFYELIGRLYLMRKERDIQLQPEHLAAVSGCLSPGCRLLVFGVGNDSSFWLEENSGGTTYFIEDNPEWAERLLRECPDANVALVTYDTQRSQWQRLMESPAKLEMADLPPEIAGTYWDVILVDAPMGYKLHHPGRMKSIFTASRLVKPGGHVFVHDCDRQVEQAYCDRFLKPENLVEELDNFRHYQMLA